MLLKLRQLLLASALCGSAAGCAHRPQPESQLGRVVVYRNGVAYFERRATVDGSFSIEVPRGRVDDFLKSLTVVDLKDHSPLAVSYETPRHSLGGSVTMHIDLPPGPRNVLITYVTESPAWKPSYRVMLDEGGKATLQSLAVVDNVSNEPWEDVRVGVGTTSALSFRYDLHSVRMVERQTLEDRATLAQAPPKGGSAYSVDGNERRVLANIDPDALDATIREIAKVPVGASTYRDFSAAVDVSGSASADAAGVSLAGTSSAESKYTVEGANVRNPAHAGRSSRKVRRTGRDKAKAEAPGVSPVARLAKQLLHSTDAVRIEGRRLEGEDATVALRRANTLRERLIRAGVEAHRIEVAEVDGWVNDPAQTLEVVAIDRGPTMTQAANGQDDNAPRGSALFVAEDPLSLDVGHSAMVTLLEAETEAERVYLYDPTSERGSTRFAFNAVRVANPTEHTLDGGPVTVYAKDQYLGEGLAEPIPPHAHALVPYALDRTVRVAKQVEGHDEIQAVVHVQRGVATTDAQRVRTTALKLRNLGTRVATVHVRHNVPSGWTSRDLPPGTERYGDDVLVPVEIGPGKQVRLTLEETMPLQATLDLRSTDDLVTVKRYLASGKAPAMLASNLQRLVDAHEKSETLSESLRSQHDTIERLRGRVRELRDQLAVLRKSKRAQSLSSHLAKQMREVSDKLDDALRDFDALKHTWLEAQIQLSSVVADLSMRPAKVATRE